MAKRDYYETLGVGKTANGDELKAAFRKLAKQYHPDVNKETGADEHFKEINEAYAVLSDEQKRAAYDRFGHAGVNGGMGGGQDYGGFGVEVRRARLAAQTRRLRRSARSRSIPC